MRLSEELYRMQQGLLRPVTYLELHIEICKVLLTGRAVNLESFLHTRRKSMRNNWKLLQRLFRTYRNPPAVKSVFILSEQAHAIRENLAYIRIIVSLRSFNNPFLSVRNDCE